MFGRLHPADGCDSLGIAVDISLSEKRIEQMATKDASKQLVVTLKHLAAELSEKHEISKKVSTEILTNLVALIAKNLKKGNKLRLTGFGILQVRKRPARMGRNPATGEAIKIKASKKVAFRAAKDLKEAV
jgi:DNA-binding protein HU-beta